MKMFRSMTVSMPGLLLAVLLLAAPLSAAHADEMGDAVLNLQHAWAKANYATPEGQKEGAFKALVERAEALAAKYPQRAEPKIWEAIIRAGYAGAMGGLSSMLNAMPQMKQGRDLLLAAEKIDPLAMHGSIYTTLGSFYYMVPGSFIGFGDDDKALAYLSKGLAMAPEDMDANYFMGDYWLEMKKYKQARPYFEKVIALPAVADRPLYSRGRKAEAAEKLAAVKARLHIK